MELDRKIFARVEHVLREQPHLGLNGEADKLRCEIDRLGKTATDFRKDIPDGQRKVVRRAVREALGLFRTPNDVATFNHLHDIYADVEKVASDDAARHRVHRFTRYIASTRP